MDSKYSLMGKSPQTKLTGNGSSASPNKHKMSPTVTKPFTNSISNFHKKPRLDSPKAMLKVNRQNGAKLFGGSYGGRVLFNDRELLPVYFVRDSLLNEIQSNPSVIVIGETGSGKTTQIPQYMHEIGLDEAGMIGITQPRRVAAITIATRVAEEMGTKLGDVVGYCVRFEDVTTPRTKMKYLTDGMLLREAMLDNMLMGYSAIVLDEAHERTVNTDVLFGIIKQAQIARSKRNLKPLKIIIMSATMDVDHFSDYFGNIPILFIQGRQHPVKVFHSTQKQEDYVFSCLVTIFQIHKDAPPNEDILVFLTGQEEIEALANSIRILVKELPGKYPDLKICLMYSSLPTNKQLEVFQATPQQMRKVVLSTNIAETSVTIPGIKYVIDSGMVKVRTHHPATGMDVLKVEKISQAQAWQRTGRAGRESAGSCYRIFTKMEFDSMSKNSVPEIQRCNLTSVVLQLTALKINTKCFDFMDKPPKEAIDGALEQLKHLGAIQSIESSELTDIGNKMAQFPLDPRFSKILIAAKDFGCLEEILSVVAMLSSESVFTNPIKKRDEAFAARQKFTSMDGDHITMLNVFKAYKNIRDKKKQWCFDNFLMERNLLYACEVRSQLAELCRRCGMPSSTCGQNLDQVRKCLLAGLFMNIAELQQRRQYFTVRKRQPVFIHPSSVLFSSYPKYVLFTEVVQSGRSYLRQLSPIEPEWLQDIAQDYMIQHRLSVSDS